MLFAKDYVDNQLPYKKSDKFFMFKVFISAIFLALAIFLYLIGKDTLIGVIVLFAGIVWNLFIPLNNFYSFVMSIIMGIVYALVCYGLGLVANAFLYLAYYVPMQYLACQNKGDTYILQNKILNRNQSIFVLVYYVLFFVGIYTFSSSIHNSWLCLLDSLSATLLAISAFTRNLRIKNYYKVRISAVSVSVFMWALIASGTALYPGSVCILLMYVLYLIHDIATLIYEKQNYTTVELEEIAKKKAEKDKIKAEQKKQEYHKIAK